MNLFVDQKALVHIIIFIFVFGLILFIFRKKKRPHLNLSIIPSLNSKSTIKGIIAKYNHYLLYLSLFSYLLAYLDPHYYKKKEEHPQSSQEGIAIYLVLDISLSMLEKITQFSGKEWKQITKIDYLKNITSEFIRGNEELQGRNDLLGIVTFARSAHILTPLTLDHKAVLNQLSKLKVNHDENEKGTVLGYAIYKTSHLIEATKHFAENQDSSDQVPFAIKNSVIVLVTDGFQEVNPLDYNNSLRSIELVDAINYAKNLGIHVYIINIDPKIVLDQYKDFRKFFQLLTKSTGGDFFYVDDRNDLNRIYAEIGKIEKSSIYKKNDVNFSPEIYEKARLSTYPLILGLISILIYIFLETIFLRRFP